MRASNARPYSVAGTAGKDNTHGWRGSYGFDGIIVTERLQ